MALSDFSLGRPGTLGGEFARLKKERDQSAYLAALSPEARAGYQSGRASVQDINNANSMWPHKRAQAAASTYTKRKFYTPPPQPPESPPERLPSANTANHAPGALRFPKAPTPSANTANHTPKPPRTPATLNDSDLAQKYYGADIYQSPMTNPQDRREYGSAIYSGGLGLQGATKAGFAAGPTTSPKGPSLEEQRANQAYWQQVRAEADAGIARRALMKGAFNPGNPEGARQSAMAQLGGLADAAQRGATAAREDVTANRDTDIRAGESRRLAKKDMMDDRRQGEANQVSVLGSVLDATTGNRQADAQRYSADRGFETQKYATDAETRLADTKRQDELDWFNDPVPEPIPDNATEGMYAAAQARNDAAKEKARQKRVDILNWMDEQTAAKKPVTILDAYQAVEGADEYMPAWVAKALYGPQSYAEGGMVEDPGPDPALVAQYQDYVTRTQEVGATPVPFEAFSQMQSGAMQMFANGGSVAGKMVLDTDPNAPVDSIPATVDDESPARLNSGEFVFPADVVAHFGTDRLNKMIQAARKGAMEGVQ